MKSILLGTICDIACVLYFSVALLLVFCLPLIVFAVCAILFHWLVIALIPFFLVAPSCIASWIEDNFSMDWAFKNSNCFYGYK